MAISAPTVTNSIGLLVDLLLVRPLTPFHANLGKRLVKSPKVYVRDSGLTHALLGIQTMDDLLRDPIAGPSWEGFVIESLLAVAPAGTSASFYQSSGGAEIDLIPVVSRRFLEENEWNGLEIRVRMTRWWRT